MTSPSRDGQILAFLAAHGWRDAERQPMGADWSSRRYERIGRDGRTAILMDSLNDAPVGPFVAVDGWLRGIGLHAPEVLAADEPARLLLLEDMGDDLLARVIAEGRGGERALYGLALEAILRFQAAPAPDWLPPLDEAGLLGLLDLFLDHAVSDLSAAARDDFAGVWRGLLPLTRTGPDAFLYRDYHAENLLWLPAEPSLWGLGLLDFQDAFRGPAAYDLVSLVQDARRDVSPATAAALVDAYLAARPGLGRDALGCALSVLGAQRALRILGVMARLKATRNRSFPNDMRPRVLGHLQASLAHPALAEMRRWCDRMGVFT